MPHLRVFVRSAQSSSVYRGQAALRCGLLPYAFLSTLTEQGGLLGSISSSFLRCGLLPAIQTKDFMWTELIAQVSDFSRAGFRNGTARSKIQKRQLPKPTTRVGPNADSHRSRGRRGCCCCTTRTSKNERTGPEGQLFLSD
jgi:hypothetical protein